MLAGLPLPAKRGSLAETAAEATERQPGSSLACVSTVRRPDDPVFRVRTVDHASLRLCRSSGVNTSRACQITMTVAV